MREAKWNASQIYWIYSTCQSGKRVVSPLKANQIFRRCQVSVNIGLPTGVRGDTCRAPQLFSQTAAAEASVQISLA